MNSPTFRNAMKTTPTVNPLLSLSNIPTYLENAERLPVRHPLCRPAVYREDPVTLLNPAVPVSQAAGNDLVDLIKRWTIQLSITFLPL